MAIQRTVEQQFQTDWGPDPLDEIGDLFKAGIYVLDAPFAPPLALGGKIYNVTRLLWLPGSKSKHPHRSNFIPFAGGRIGAEFRERVFELKCQARPHNANAVDSVDQDFGVFVQYVARLVLNHIGSR